MTRGAARPRRSTPLLRAVSVVALLLTGAVAGFTAAMSLDPAPALSSAPSHTSESLGEQHRDPLPGTELEWGARAGTYVDVKAVAGRPVGSVTFMGADGRRWRCFEAMIP